MSNKLGVGSKKKKTQITFEFNRLTIVFNISPYCIYKLSYTQSILFIFIIQESNNQIKIGGVLCSGLGRCMQKGHGDVKGV